MSDEARQTPGEPVQRDPWAPPEDRAPQSTPPAQPDAAAAPEVSLSKPDPTPGRDPWAPPAESAHGAPSVHDQATVGPIPGAGPDTAPPTAVPTATPTAAPADPWQSPAGHAHAPAPGYGYPAGQDAVPPPPVSPEGPGQAPSPYAVPAPGPTGHPGHPGYPGYPGYPSAAGYGWSQMPMQPSNGMGVTSLVLGIIAATIFCLWPIAIIVGILAIIFGAIGRAKAKRGEATNPGQALAGLICGIVGVALGVVLLVVAVATADDSSDDSNPFDGISAAVQTTQDARIA